MAVTNIITIAELLAALGITDTVTAAEQAIAELAITSTEGAIKRFLGYSPVQGTRTEFYPRQSFGAYSGEVYWEANDSIAYQRRLGVIASDQLQLIGVPIRSITSLYVDYNGRSGIQVGSFASETLKTEGTDFWPNYEFEDSSSNPVCTDGILHSVGLWPLEPGTVKVTYVSGYTSTELRGTDDVIDATPIWASALDEAVRWHTRVMQNQKSAVGYLGPKTSERLGDYSYSLNAGLAAKLYGSGYQLSGESVMRLQPFTHLGFMA